MTREELYHQKRRMSAANLVFTMQTCGTPISIEKIAQDLQVDPRIVFQAIGPRGHLRKFVRETTEGYVLKPGVSVYY